MVHANFETGKTLVFWAIALRFLTTPFAVGAVGTMPTETRRTPLPGALLFGKHYRTNATELALRGPPWAYG